MRKILFATSFWIGITAAEAILFETSCDLFSMHFTREFSWLSWEIWGMCISLSDDTTQPPAPQVHNICRKSAATEMELPGKYLPGNQTDPWNDA